MQKDFDSWNHDKKKIHKREPIVCFGEREIWLCTLGLNIGSEQDGGKHFSRPILVIKKFNNYIFWGVPLTTSYKKNEYYFGLKEMEESAVILSQLRLLSTKRMMQHITTVTKEEFRELIAHIRNLLPDT